MGASSSNFTEKTRKAWIIGGSVGAVVFVATAIALAIVLTRSNENAPIPPVPPGGHKYKCLSHANGHQCVVDDTHGTCSTNDCCRFTCVNGVCKYGCTGTYEVAVSCIMECSGMSSQGFDCSTTGICQPTTSTTSNYPNDPCCGSCPDGCMADITNLTVLNADVINGPLGTGPYFGTFIKSQVTESVGKLRSAVLTSVDETSIFVLTLDDTNNTLEFNPDAIELQRHVGTVKSIAFGNQAGAAAIVYQETDQPPYGQMVSETAAFGLWSIIAYNFMVDPTPSYLHQSSPSTLFYAADGKYNAINVVNSPISTNPPTGTSASAVTAITAGEVQQDRLVFFGCASEGNITLAIYNVDASTWTSTTLNPLVHARPSDAINFGQFLSCSNDASVLLIGADNYVCLYELVNGSSPINEWRWGSIGRIQQGLVSNVAVSPDGLVLAWGDGQKGLVTVASREEGEAGFHDTQLISIKDMTNPIGFGGLDVIKVSSNKYAVLAASGNHLNPTSSDNLFYYGIVQRIG